MCIKVMDPKDWKALAASGPPWHGAIVGCVSAFVERVRCAAGRETMLYGGSYLAELGITDRMGAKWLAIARYTPTLPAQVVTRIGWDLGSVVLWQYCGDGTAGLAGYPSEALGVLFVTKQKKEGEAA